MKELKYELVDGNLVLDEYIVIGLDHRRIAISLLWLKRAGFSGSFTVYEGMFGSKKVYTTNIRKEKKVK